MTDSSTVGKVVLLAFMFFGFMFVKHCGQGFGVRYSDGKQSEVVIVELPAPQSPSKVFGIGEAMEKGQDILIFRQTRKASALPLNESNFFFISKLLESYSPQVKVIEIGNTVSYPNGDYFMTLLDNLPANGYGVVKNEDGQYKLYKSSFGYSEVYEEMVLPVQTSIEEVLGPSGFDKKNLITSTSRYKDFIKAKQEGRNIILYSFANACSSLPVSEQKKIESQLKSKFSKQALIVKINHKYYTDPANDLFLQCQNTVGVYNGRSKEIYPALFTGNDVMKKVGEFLKN